MRKLLLVLLAAAIVGGCLMPRSIRSVQRISRVYGRPFFGLAAHQHPTLLPPNYATIADQVTIEHGTIRPRLKFQIITSVQASFSNHTTLGLYGFLQRDPATGSTPVVRSITIALMNKTIVGGTVIRVFDADDDATQFTDVRTVNTSDTISDKHVNFFLVGITGREVIAKNIPPYTVMVYMLDGDTRMLKTSGTHLSNTYFLWPIGIKAPTALSWVEVNTGGNFSGGDGYAYAVSLCNRFVAPDTASVNDPGQEGNAVFDPAKVVSGADQTYRTFTSGSTNKTELTITVSNGNIVSATEDDFWTHARLYRRKSDETTWKFVGNWHKHADYVISGDIGALTALGSFQYKLTDIGPSVAGSSGNDVTLGIGAYDYAPTRNNVPEKMHHFASYRGRGFWANKFKRFVFYSDNVGALTGGNYEALSHEFLPLFDGTIGLLVSFRDGLAIGTPKKIYMMRGDLSSHTNASVSRAESLGVFFPDLDEIAVDYGPIESGTGSYVIVQNLLYFISPRGMAAFDGSKVIDVSQALRDVANNPLGSELDNAILTHDQELSIIYFLARDTTASTANIFAYHYDIVDPQTGLGAWTQWKSDVIDIGGLKVDKGIDQIAMFPSKTFLGRKRLMISRLSDTSGTLRVELQRQAFDVSDGLDPEGGYIWKWRSARNTFGVPDRRKHFWFVTIHMETTDDSITVKTYIEGANAISTSYSNLSTDGVVALKVPIGRVGYDIMIEVTGTTTTNALVRLLAYELEATILGHY